MGLYNQVPLTFCSKIIVWTTAGMEVSSFASEMLRNNMVHLSRSMRLKKVWCSDVGVRIPASQKHFRPICATPIIARLATSSIELKTSSIHPVFVIKFRVWVIELMSASRPSLERW